MTAAFTYIFAAYFISAITLGGLLISLYTHTRSLKSSLEAIQKVRE